MIVSGIMKKILIPFIIIIIISITFLHPVMSQGDISIRKIFFAEEAGAGFAVVADEVWNLAIRAANAAKIHPI